MKKRGKERRGKEPRAREAPDRGPGPTAEDEPAASEREEHRDDGDGPRGEPSSSETAGPALVEDATESEQRLQEQLTRLMADFDNYRKRVRKEQADVDLSIRGRLIEKLLPILDDYDRARGAAGPQEHPADRDVLLRILGRLADVLKGEGLSLIELQPGAPFDPSAHEAIGTAYSESIPAQHVMDVFEPGYVFNGQLLRPARVLVSMGVEGSRDRESRAPEATRTGDGDKADDGADRKDSDE